MVKDDWFLTPDGAENGPPGEHMQVIDAWDMSDDEESDAPSKPPGNITPEKTPEPPRSKAARIKDHQAERAIRSLISIILRTLRAEEISEHERQVGRRRIEEEADQRIAEYLIGSRKGVATDELGLLTNVSDAGVLHDNIMLAVPVLDPKGPEEFDGFREFLVPVISRHFEKEEYDTFVRKLVLNLAEDMKGAAVKRLSSELGRLASEIIRRESTKSSGKS